MRKTLLQNNRGQAAIEFITIVVVIFFFLLFYLSLTIVLVTSDYVDYATYMTARTFKTGYGSPEGQQRNAQDIFNAYLGRVDGIAKNYSVAFTEATPGDPNTGGVISTYQMDLFYLPPVFLKRGPTPVSRITLSSEAHLGRDPTNSECLQFFQNYLQKIGLGNIGGAYFDQLEDNAC